MQQAPVLASAADPASPAWQANEAAHQELADALRRFLQVRPIRARPPSWGTRLFKWGRRHQFAVVAGVVGLAVLVVVLASAAALLWQEQVVSQPTPTTIVIEADAPETTASDGAYDRPPWPASRSRPYRALPHSSTPRFSA